MPHERRNYIVRLPSLSTLRHSPERGIGDEDLGQQARMCDAALNRQPGHGTLLDMAAVGAHPFATDRADHLAHRCDARELFRYILAEQVHADVAFRADRIGLKHAFFAWKVRR